MGRLGGHRMELWLRCRLRSDRNADVAIYVESNPGGVAMTVGTGLCSTPFPGLVVGITMKVDVCLGVPTMDKGVAVDTAGVV